LDAVLYIIILDRRYIGAYHYRLDSFVCRVGNQLSLKTVVGCSKAQISYHITDNVQMFALGGGAMSSLTLHFCPRLCKITTSQNDHITCGQIPLKSSNTP